MRYQSLSEHLCRKLACFLRRFAQMDAALESICEGPLPSSAGGNLRLQHEIARPKFARHLLRFFGSRRHLSRRRSHSEFLEQLFGLVFVNVHRNVRRALSLEMRARQSFSSSLS